MASRTELHKLLKGAPGIKEVYFQPPESKKLEYPCIVYSLSDIYVRHANNLPYMAKKAYDVTLISQTPDTKIVDYLTNLPLCRFGRFFASDNLNHYTFKIYY